MNETLFWILGIVAFLLVSFLFAQLFKRYYGAQVYFGFVSMIRSTSVTPWFDKLSQGKRFWKFLSTLGIIVGFGSVALDQLFWKNYSMVKRIIANVLSFFLLVLLFQSTLGSLLSGPSLDDVARLISAVSFGLFGLAGFTLFSLFQNAVDVLLKTLLGQKALPGVAPLIPGVKLPNVPLFVPLHGWISLLIILIVHEASHGVLARIHGVKVKSAGVLLAGILPVGAFVEPDEKQVEKMESEKALQLLAAGPSSNLALFGIVMVVLAVFSAFFVVPFASQEVVIRTVEEFTVVNGEFVSSPAFGVLESGMVVQSINGVSVTRVSDFSAELKKDNVVTLTGVDENGVPFSHTLSKNSHERLGIEVAETQDLTNVPMVPFIIAEFLFWLAMLNFLVGMVNFLPMPPFDGGRMVMILGAAYLPGKNEKEKRFAVGKFFLYGTLVLLLVNMLPLFI